MRNRARAGFTLIELMVAMALTLFIMVIMSQAFVTSLETFSAMKGLAEMTRNLRTAEVLLRDDLAKDHFEGKRRLSDLNATNAANIVAQPPQAGFFAVRRGSAVSAAGPAYVFEGNDGFGVPSFRATDHLIYMTVKARGNRQENFFNGALQGDAAVLANFFSLQTAFNIPAADLPNGTLTLPYQGGSTTGVYSSQWTEVMYYLKQTGTTSNVNDPTSTIGTPTFGLYRAQWVMLPDTTAANAAGFPSTAAGTFAGLSCNVNPANKVEFFSPADAAQLPGKRVIPTFDPTGFNPAAFSRQETLVCPNVLSFHVQVMPLTAPGVASSFQDVPSNSGQNWGVYDTTKFSSSATNGYPALGLKAIQITLRVWDQTTQQTRQLTVVQDL